MIRSPYDRQKMLYNCVLPDTNYTHRNIIILPIINYTFLPNYILAYAMQAR